MFALLIGLFIACGVHAQSHRIIATALLNGNSIEIESGWSHQRNAVAWASYEQMQNETGWNILKINTTESANFK